MQVHTKLEIPTELSKVGENEQLLIANFSYIAATVSLSLKNIINMRALRFNDLHSPFAPFSYVEEKINSRKNIKCHISNKIIEKGENIYAFRLFSFEQDITLFAKKIDFEASSYFINYRDYYLKNQYSIEHFKNFEGFKHSDYKKVLNNFSFDYAIKLITNPTTQPKPYCYSSGKITNECSEEERLKIDLTAISTLVSILIKCGYSNQILSKIKEFPKISLPVFALLDDRRFQNKVADILALDDLPLVLDILRKKKLSLDNFNTLKSFSSKNKPFIELLSLSLKKYQLHLLDGLTNRGSYMDIRPPHNCKLIYFFIVNPEYFPLLHKYISYKELPSGFTYMKCYYYRAAMFHIIDNYPNQLASWIENMENEIKYYYSGSPKGFINDSIKMMKAAK